MPKRTVAQDKIFDTTTVKDVIATRQFTEVELSRRRVCNERAEGALLDLVGSAAR